MKWLYGQLNGIKRFIRFINILLSVSHAQNGIDPSILITGFDLRKSTALEMDADESV